MQGKLYVDSRQLWSDMPCEAAREAVVTHTHLGGEPPELSTVLGSWDILQGPCRGFPFGLQMAIFLLCPQNIIPGFYSLL